MSDAKYTTPNQFANMLEKRLRDINDLERRLRAVRPQAANYVLTATGALDRAVQILRREQ